MDASRTKHLWRSSEVRSALGKEAWCLFVFVVIYVGTVAVSRYLREKPAFEGFLSAAIGAVEVILIWLVSAVRTLRAVSRENDAPPLRARRPWGRPARAAQASRGCLPARAAR